MPAMIPTPDLSTVLPNRAECSQRIRPMFQTADVHPAYPTTTGFVVEVLREGGGYDVDIDVLNRWAENRLVGEIRDRGNGFEWQPEHIAAAAIHCETWRRFRPLDQRHLHKLSAIEAAEMEAAANGTTTFTDLESFDVQALTLMLERTEDKHVRHALGVALRSKLKRMDVEL